jgi:large repetitive protein
MPSYLGKEDAMSSETQAAAQDESSAGSSFVTARGIISMSAYLVVIFSILLYSLIAIWPRVLPLAITSFKPGQGQTKGGDEVNVVGTGFTDSLQVFFGDVPAKSVTRKSDNLLIVITPASQAGPVTVEIDSSDGHKAMSPDRYVFNDGSADSSKLVSTAQPQCPLSTSLINCATSSLPFFAWACSLDSGVRLILIVVIVGSLGALIHVARSFYWYVGNRNLKSSWLLMYFFLPFNGGGLALLFFLVSRGVSSAQPAGIEPSVGGYAALAALVGMFSQQALMKLKQIAESVFSPAEKGKDQATSSAAPKITSIQPIGGPLSGGTKVVITGTGFSSVSHVTFDGVPAGTMAVANDTQITVMAPPHLGGKVDIEVVTSSGQKASLPGGFTYQDLAVTSVAPGAGPAAGGTSVTIRGNGFGPGATVKIGGAPASSVSVIDPNSLSAVTPQGNIGVADIEITNSDGKVATLRDGFTFS